VPIPNLNSGGGVKVSHARRWIGWGLLAVLVLAPTLRLLAALVGGAEIGNAETVLYVLVAPFLMFMALAFVLVRSQGRGLPRLRQLYPEAVSIAVVLHADDLEGFEQLSGVALRRGRGFNFDVTFEPTVVRFWRGIRPRLVARIPSAGAKFDVGQITTLAGAFPALTMTIRSARGVCTFRLTPMRERNTFFPRQLDSAQTAALVEELNDRAGAELP
jgi:hypothetical protein